MPQHELLRVAHAQGKCPGLWAQGSDTGLREARVWEAQAALEVLRWEPPLAARSAWL